jgi:integrase
VGGNTKGFRRRFGAVRQFRSGRWGVSYTAPDGLVRRAEQTFVTRRDAEIWLSQVEADISRDRWVDPDAGRVPFGEYAAAWVAEHPGLAPRTRELYEALLRRHLTPTFGNWYLRDIRGPSVRAWRKARLDAGIGAVTVAKAYRLLRAILNTAVDDGLIQRNPCRIKSAGVERTAERATLAIDQVYAIADAIDQRYRAMVLAGAFLGLRFGELAGLRRTAVDLDALTIRINVAQSELRDGTIVDKQPKSEAGRRILAVPASLAPEFRRHLEWFAQHGPDGLVFVGPRGARLRAQQLQSGVEACARPYEDH